MEGSPGVSVWDIHRDTDVQDSLYLTERSLYSPPLILGTTSPSFRCFLRFAGHEQVRDIKMKEKEDPDKSKTRKQSQKISERKLLYFLILYDSINNKPKQDIFRSSESYFVPEIPLKLKKVNFSKVSNRKQSKSNPKLSY